MTFKMREKTERNYSSYIPEMALAIIVGPFRNAALWKEFKDAAWHVGMFVIHLVFWLLCMATYPVSVPFLAWLAKMADRSTDRHLDRADREWLREMNRGNRGASHDKN